MRKGYAALTLLGLLMTASAARAADPDKAEILKVVKTLTDGWREADGKKVESALHPDFRLVTRRESPQGPEVQIDTRASLLSSVSKIKPGSWDDRLRGEEVRVDATGIATVWAKYKFYINGKLHHCGIESFQLYKMADGWKIVNFADTHGETNCDSQEPGKP